MVSTIQCAVQSTADSNQTKCYCKKHVMLYTSDTIEQVLGVLEHFSRIDNVLPMSDVLSYNEGIDITEGSVKPKQPLLYDDPVSEMFYYISSDASYGRL